MVCSLHDKHTFLLSKGNNVMVGQCPPKSYSDVLASDACERDLVWK